MYFWEPEIVSALENSRLLLISPFDVKISRITLETAEMKNETIISIADKIVVGYESKGGQLEKLLDGAV